MIAEQTADDDADIRAMTEALVAEFAGLVPPARVWLCIDACRTRMLLTGVRHGLAAATEAAARITLVAELRRVA